MKTMTKSALLTGAVFPLAFDSGKPGWKMDGDKIAVDGEGNPIWMNSAGQEQSVKGDTISNLNAEAKQHRTAKEAVEAQLAKFKGPDGKLLDPEVAAKAVDTVSKLDAKKLIDAGEVDKVRDTIKAEYTQQLSEQAKALEGVVGENHQLKIARVFDGSEFVRERIAVPRDMFEAAFRPNFKIGTDGKIEAYDRTGNRLMSKKNVGEYADPSEALELLVEAHPQKDTILKAAQQGGTGNNGGGGQRGGNGRTMKRSEFDSLDPGAQAQAGVAMGKGELTIVD